MSLRQDLEKLLNRHNAEAASNTPDWILAGFLVDCLRAFETASTAREDWYGYRHAPGQAAPVEASSEPKCARCGCEKSCHNLCDEGCECPGFRPTTKESEP